MGIHEKIKQIKNKMDTLDKGSVAYRVYDETVKELEEMAVKVHVTDEICESCQ